MATITYQNLFKMFRKLGGMTGTGKVAEAEFLDTYAMSVIKIPTNRKKIRQDLPDEIYQTLPEKVFASLEYIKEVHANGNPILVLQVQLRCPSFIPIFYCGRALRTTS